MNLQKSIFSNQTPYFPSLDRVNDLALIKFHKVVFDLLNLSIDLPIYFTDLGDWALIFLIKGIIDVNVDPRVLFDLIKLDPHRHIGLKNPL